jgi:hypothetical protein
MLSSANALAVVSEPEYAFLSWESKGPNTHETRFGPTTGLMLFTTIGDDIVYPRPFFADRRSFVDEYGSELPAMWFENGAGGSAANGFAQMIFSPPLPQGSQLIVLDVDIVTHNERIEITSVGGMLTLLTQVETQSGANSAFPTWNSATGLLRSVRMNEAEATIFDVSGVEGLAMRYLRNVGGPGISGIQFAIAVPVPEPGAVLLVAMALPCIRNERRRFCG